MRTLGLSALAAGLLAAGIGYVVTGPRQAATQIVVYKSPTCGCCSLWAGHLAASGFDVSTVDEADLTRVKTRYKVPASLQSCHTAVVEGYVIEGHVPAADIERLLEERPAIAGLAVPGMPVGSPGMESPNPQPYAVTAFTGAGQTSVFARH